METSFPIPFGVILFMMLASLLAGASIGSMLCVRHLNETFFKMSLPSFKTFILYGKQVYQSQEPNPEEIDELVKLLLKPQ